MGAISSQTAKRHSAAANGFGEARGFTSKRSISALPWIMLLTVLLAGILLIRPAEVYLRVISVIARFSDPQDRGLATRFASHKVREETGIIQTEWGPLKYRIYTPLNVSHPGGLVLIHGIHREGIEEPRLINFSRALAAAEVEVLTPELSDLTDYRVTSHTSDVIGYSAEFLSKRMNQPKVGVVGLSFSGGLALIAATTPRYAERIGLVLALGAHSDLARVARFLATNVVEMPDGNSRNENANEYGALVVAYSHVEDFFSEADVPSAQQALKLWLSEMPDQARELITRLSPQGQERFTQLLYHRDQLKDVLLWSIKVHEHEMAAASPKGRLRTLTVPVYLLHAARDDVIPASESLWLCREIPKKQLRAVLISPAIIHADVQEQTSLWQKWQLVNFLARLLRDVDRLGGSGGLFFSPSKPPAASTVSGQVERYSEDFQVTRITADH